MVFSDFNHTGKAFPFSIPSRYQFTQNILHSRKLPQTGNESSMGMMLIGLVTLLLSLGLVVISRFTI
nr:LPXTG cell wall anchor domain-containing protein [Limosilactobacillus fermentum]